MHLLAGSVAVTEAERMEWTRYIEGTLQGSCEIIEGGEYEHLLDNQEFCDLLDSLIFCCEVCDWWCEVSEKSGDRPVCLDCEDEE